jgi:type IV pilus assembly protein PilV
MKAPHSYTTERQQGLTLIEVLITLLIMATGLMGLAALQVHTVKESVDTSRRSQGVWLVEELIARLRVNPAGAESGGYTTAANKASLCTAGPAKHCADYFSGSAKSSAAADCSADQMAEFDVWQVMCGYDNDGVISGNTDNINITAFDLDCADSDTTDTITCSPRSPFTVTLSWESKVINDSSNANTASAESATQTITQVFIP